MLLGLSLLLAVFACEALDCLAQPVRPLFAGGPIVLAWRAAAIALIWLLAFGLSGRALLALAAAVVTVGVVVGISNAKRRYLREPLVFSDFALLEHAVRHPQLFYVPRRWMSAAIAGVIALIAAIAAWMAIEPRAASGVAQEMALLAVILVMAMAWFAPWTRAAAVAIVREPDIDADVARLGLLVSLTAYAVAWRHDDAPVHPTAKTEPLSPPYDAIVVVQAESFVDLRRLGYAGLRLPAFDKFKERALSSGLLEVPCQGAYTLRPESAVLTGRGFFEQGFDRFHPYLRPGRLAGNALPRLLAAEGWDTLFVHPFDRRFFRRHRAMPAMGFAGFADGRAFSAAKRYGPYVSDEAVGEFLLATIERRQADDRPLFAYAVTIEAHDPYGIGRLPDENDPVRQYVRHLENADRMLGQIGDRLDKSGKRALLVFFGDHVPFLPSLADPFPDTRTDYLVVELGAGKTVTTVDCRISRPEHLHALIRQTGSASAFQALA